MTTPPTISRVASASAPRPLERTAAAAIALSAGLALFLILPATVQTGLAAALLVLGGLPHGASDHALAAPVWRARLGRLGVPMFLAGYVACAALVFVAWRAVPLAALLAFLALSAWHFAREDAVGGSRWERVARGLMPIGLPALLHPAALTELLLPLLAGSAGDARVAAAVMSACGVGAVFGLAGWWWREGRVPPLAAASAVALLICPPLLGFALFFALDHSRRAAGRRRSSLCLSASGYARACAPFVAGGAVVLAGAAWWLPDAGLPGWLVVGLAALTVPHMLLVPEVGDENFRIPLSRSG